MKSRRPVNSDVRPHRYLRTHKMETYLIGRGHVVRATRGYSSQMMFVSVGGLEIARRPRCCGDEKTRVTIWGGRTNR